MDSHSPLYFNGINASTGDYLFPPSSAEALAREVTGHSPSEEQGDHLADLRARFESTSTAHYGVKSGIDVRDLAQTGWGVVFPAVRPDTEEARRQDAIAEALMPLLDLRRAQATARDERCFKIYRGLDGYRPDEGKQRYLARLGAGPGPADPLKVPYYLLLVGDPDDLPYSLQYQLDVQYAVGRIHFDTLADYGNYARSVVSAETGGLRLARELAMFGVANADDPATQLSAQNLVAPLADLLAPLLPDWKIRRYEGAEATKANLGRILGGDQTPAVVFTASHGTGFNRGDARQRPHQGALLCQDWPGPVAWRGPLAPDFYFAGEDLRHEARPHGLIMFNFACYGAGTPRYNDYGQRSGAKARTPIADAPFLAALPQRLLAHPGGGALATIGHVERAWGCSFVWRGSGKKTGSSAQLAVFESAMRDLLGGMPVGAALECFNARYAELASDLSVELEEIGFGRNYNPMELADMWTANNDARGYTIIGDPAVRLPLAPVGGTTLRPVVAEIVLGRAAESAPIASTPASRPAPSAEVFDVLAALRDQLGAGSGPFQGLAVSLLQTLEKTLTDLATLEIRTFVASDMQAASADPHPPSAGAELRAFTRVRSNGALESYIPASGDGADKALWDRHADMVRQAQAHRAELLRALLEAGISLAKR